MAAKKSECDNRLDAHYEQITNLSEQLSAQVAKTEKLEAELAALKAAVVGAIGLPS